MGDPGGTVRPTRIFRDTDVIPIPNRHASVYFLAVMQPVTRHARILLFVGISLTAASSSALARPWPARQPTREPKPAHQLRNPATWPAEPALPAPIDATKFQQSLAHLCNVEPDSSVAALAPRILEAAATAATDPFTLAALALFTSRCDPKFHKDGAYGLPRIF